MSDSLPPSGLQHAKLPFPLLSPRVCSNSCPLIETMIPSNYLILCHPLLLLPSVFPSIRVFSNELALCARWPKYWSFSFSISPSNEYSRLISVRIDWLILLLSKGLSKESSSAHNLKAFVVQSISHVRLCDPTDWGTSGFPILHCLPEFVQTQVHCVSDAIQPSHSVTPFSSCPQSFQHQGLFQWVS